MLRLRPKRPAGRDGSRIDTFGVANSSVLPFEEQSCYFRGPAHHGDVVLEWCEPAPDVEASCQVRVVGYQGDASDQRACRALGSRLLRTTVSPTGVGRRGHRVQAAPGIVRDDIRLVQVALVDGLLPREFVTMLCRAHRGTSLATTSSEQSATCSRLSAPSRRFCNSRSASSSRRCCNRNWLSNSLTSVLPARFAVSIR